MTNRFVWAALVCGFAAVAACSSSNNGSGGGGSGGGGSGGSCAESLTGTGGSACGACEQSKCSSQMSGIESGCSDLLSCVCPSGTYNASLVEQCASKAEESSCTSASQAMSACVSANCSSECEGTSSSSGGSSSGGSSSGSSSSGSSGTTDVAFCSVTSQNTCYVFGNNPGETVSGDNENCTALLGGTVATSCPTAGLVGCCLYTSPNDYECFYSGTQATDCPGVNGWTTTIP